MKTIGIKLADGSFYPVMEEGTAQTKTLELTTANNNQTCVMVDLYSSETGTLEGAEYIDTLKIDNLNAHPNGELNISFSVSQDEDGKLSTNIVDKETGTNAESVSSLSHIFRDSDELANPDNFTISNLDRAKFPTVENAFNPDAPEEFDLDAPSEIPLEAADSPADEAFSGDTTLTMDEMPDTNGAETIDAPLDFAMTSPSDIAMEDFSEDVMSKEIPSDISFDEPSADIPADETITDDSLSDDIFADLPADETVTEDSLPDDIFADSPADETVTENADDKLFEDITTDEAVTEDSLSDDIFADDEITDDDIPDEISIPKDEPSVFDEDISKPQADEINKANGPISFSGLYDKETELGESAVHEESRKKTTIPMLICIICAVICIIATLILLISAPAKALSRKQKAKDAPKTELVKEEQIQTNETVDSVIVIENAESVTPTVPAPKKNSEKVTYRIKWGDTLWDISNNFYKNPWKFTRIAKYNKITNPDYIISGTVITIPAE